MSATPRLISIPLTVVLLIVLSGCASRAGVTPTDGPDTAVAPTATAQPDGPPQPTIPLACGDFFSESDASALLFEPVTLKLSEEWVRSLYQAAGLEAGLFHCTWGGDDNDMTDSSWNRTIDLTILPDGAAAFDEGVWQVDDGAIVYPDGSTTSEYRCDSVGTGAYCTGNVLVDGYWANVRANTYTGAEFSQDAMAANARSIVDRVTSVISSAGPARPAWVVADHTLTGAICSGQPLATVSHPPYADGVAALRATAFRCDYNSTVAVTVLPGGGWAAASAQASGRPLVYNIPPQAVTVAGADLALWTCADGCYALLSVGGSGVELYDSQYYAGSGETDFVAELPGIVAGIVAAG